MIFRVRKAGGGDQVISGKLSAAIGVEQDTEVVPISQGSPSSPHQRRIGTNLKPVGGPLQSALTGGRATTNHGTTVKYHRRSYRRGGDCGGSAETPDGTGRRTIRHEGRTPEYMAPGGDRGEIPRHREVVQIGEYNIDSI